MPRTRHPKRDANHAEVVQGCRDAGLEVWDDLADLGGAVLDILVAGYNVKRHDYEMVMVEIKPDEKAPFTEAERRILEEQPHTTMVAYCAEDVLRRFGRLG
jgi:hypothetical protein